VLVLSRRQGEVINIGNDVTITVIEIRGGSKGQVRLGVNAPNDVPVHRNEVYRAIQRDEQDDLLEGRFRCHTCGSTGFNKSVLPDRCTFCDGTEGGNPPEEGS
jgi:carbon storage regulator